MEQDIDTKAYFTFDYESEGKNVTLRFNKQDARVPEVLEEFLNFLKACGYCFDIDDYLDIVNDFRHPTLNSEEYVDNMAAEAKTYEQAADGSVVFNTAQSDWPAPEVTNFNWVEYNSEGVATEYTNTPYNPKDY